MKNVKSFPSGIIDVDFEEIPTHTTQGASDQYNWIRWRTRDGKILRIFEMNDSHLLNATKYLRRTKMDQLMNMLYHGYDIFTANAKYVVILWVLERECEKRGLSMILDPEPKGDWV